MKRSAGQEIFKYVMYGVFIFLTLLSLVPFILVIANGTRSTTQILQGVSLLPSKYFVMNYKILMDKDFDLWVGFFNSLVISSSSTVLAVYFSSLTAWGFKNYQFKFNKLLFGFIIAIILIPPQLSLIGFYQFMLKVHLTDTRIVLILPAMASPATVFFLKQYLDSIYQKDLVDAARVDGASELYIFHRIMLPIMKPGIATMAIFAFVTSWNNYFGPLILITDTDKYTLPMMVQLLTADIYRTELGSLYLGAALSIVPLLVVYVLLARNIVDGIAMGSVKG